LFFSAVLHYLRREEQAAQEHAEAAITLSREHGFPFWLGWATLFRGGALAAEGEGEAGIKQILWGRGILRASRSEVGCTGALARLAEAYGKVGQAEAGLSILAEALEVADRTGERRYEAELVQLKGELLLAQESKEQGARSKRSKESTVRSTEQE